MKAPTRSLALSMLLLALIVLTGAGCDDFLRGASHLFDDVADALDDFADDYDRHRDRDWHDRVDDILDDIEDWFD